MPNSPSGWVPDEFNEPDDEGVEDEDGKVVAAPLCGCWLDGCFLLSGFFSKCGLEEARDSNSFFNCSTASQGSSKVTRTPDEEVVAALLPAGGSLVAAVEGPAPDMVTATPVQPRPGWQ